MLNLVTNTEEKPDRTPAGRSAAGPIRQGGGGEDAVGYAGSQRETPAQGTCPWNASIESCKTAYFSKNICLNAI